MIILNICRPIGTNYNSDSTSDLVILETQKLVGDVTIVRRTSLSYEIPSGRLKRGLKTPFSRSYLPLSKISSLRKLYFRTRYRLQFPI